MPEPSPGQLAPGSGGAVPASGAGAAAGPADFATPPAISLPKGGGAIRGIGEKFATNPVTGTATATIAIAASPGRSGFGPQPVLSYDSGNGNGPFGFGWTLSLASITRKTDKGLPQYRDADESDVFVLAGAEDLVPVLEAAGRRVRDTASAPGYRIDPYRPRVEGAFARIERWTRERDRDVHWRTISRDNVLTVYGKDPNSRIADPEDPTRIFSWLICETRDDKGNAIAYEYKPEDGAGAPLDRAHQRNRGGRDDPRRSANRYLKRVRYGNRTPMLDPAGQRPLTLSDADLRDAGWMFELVFDYGEHDADAPTPRDAGRWTHRDDAFSSYRAGFEVRTARLCRRALMFHHFAQEPEVGDDCLVSSTDFTYGEVEEPAGARTPVYTFLRAVTRSGYRRRGDGYLKRSLPPVEYEYTQAVVQDAVHTVDPADLVNLPVGVDGVAYRWTDLHGEGIQGVLTEQAGEWLYKRNLSPISDRPVELAPAERVGVKPNLTLTGGQAQFLDLAGDGRPDLVVLDGPTPGLYEHDDREGWRPFRPFSSRLNRDTRDPNLRLVDLTGDGRADVLVAEHDAYVWHPSLGEEGFGEANRVHRALDEERGPCLVFGDGTDCIYLADVSGDGLFDLVRIRNSDVCYWPNLGHGRFGAKVTMDSAPRFDHPDRFDSKRIRLADIDGTGTTDIIYLHPDGVRLYFNQSGNGWSAPRHLSFPRFDDVYEVTPTDLFGNGTACLVWSSPLPGDLGRQLRYVDLIGGRKPHLLVRTANNLGAETRVEFASSTSFYLQDRRDGRPWISRLPFPVHVVTRVETLDHVSGNRFVTRFAYHHGHFDGEEREFRGFGMVEQWDTEEFDVLAADRGQPKASNVDPASHVPPVLTKTWFHIGLPVLFDEHLRREYYREPGLTCAEARQRDLPATVLPGLTPEEEREAYRALKGVVLRQEVYAQDGTDRAGIPYTVDERSYLVRCLQRRGPNRHGVFFTHSRETLSHQYERNPNDPRTSHAITLDVDAYGNVLKELAIGYGRRAPSTDPPLTAADRLKQTRPLIQWTEYGYTNDVRTLRHYRTPMPVEIRTYELTGFTPERGAGRFSFEEWSRDGFRLAASADEITYEQSPDHVGHQKRLVQHVRTLFRRDDLAGLLPLGALQPLALPGESYKLALTPGLVAQVFRRDQPDSPGEALLPDPAQVLEGTGGDQGGYTAMDGAWWIPSGRVFFDPGADPADPGRTATREVETARRHFFLPRIVIDAFGHASATDYDTHDLLVTRTSDAVGNTVTAENHYRVLQPRLLTDANRNRSAAAFDALGLVVATATMGKADEDLGDLLEDVDPDPTPAELRRFTADPTDRAASLLGKATTRTVYDPDRFRRTRQPPFAAALARETHVQDPGGPASRIRVTFSYADGLGRDIQKKVQAEPGDAPQRHATVRLPDGDVQPGDLMRDAQGQPVPAAAAPRWVGTGRTVFNNKGKPVRQYEPFFSATHLYEPERDMTDTGVSPVLFYDPVERVVATLHPNHSYEKVVASAWQQARYDVNDTVASHGRQTGDPRTDPDIRGYVREYLRTQPATWQTWYEQRISGQLGASEREAAEDAAVHANTPVVTHLDVLGRPVVAAASNRYRRADRIVEESNVTRLELDIEGNPRSVTDAKDRVVVRYDYDLLGNRIHQATMDAGERWTLADVRGKPIRGWDSRRALRRVVYDELRRQTHLYVTDDSAERLAERTVYGENLGDVGNHRTRVYQVFDEAGVVTNVAYDFKGNLLESSRELVATDQQPVDWLDHPTLEDRFVSRSAYDALDRPVAVTSPDGSVYRPTFNEASLVERIDVNLRGAAASTAFVTNIDYDAKGQRIGIRYGNGAVTRYEYDPLTFRLVHLITTRPTRADRNSSRLLRDPSVVQDLRYVYDPVGNLSRINDAAFSTVFHDGRRVDTGSRYRYDALYRLIEAQGREHIGQTALDREPADGNYRDHPFAGSRIHPHDLQGLRPYIQRFWYDPVGNIELVRHLAGGGSWTRRYTYDADSPLEAGTKSNRLTGTTLGNHAEHVESYAHDAHGNMTAMPHLPSLTWNVQDQLQQVRLTGGRTAHYGYDAASQRVRKVITDGDSGRRIERIYVGGYERYREYRGDVVIIARDSLHVLDDKQRVALVEAQTVEDGEPTDRPATCRYQLTDHLGSPSVELDGDASLISYEEHHPFGTTALQVGRSAAEASLKRYRYTGKERDEETGFSYHGARYYVPWLGRWTSCDRAATRDYLSSDAPPYTYVQNRPTVAVDPDGGLVWFLAAAIVVAVVATPQIANAPGPNDKTYSRSTGELALNMAENAVMIYAAPRLLAGGAAVVAEQGLVRGAATIATRVGIGYGVAKTVTEASKKVDASGTLGRVLNLSLALYLLRPRTPTVTSGSNPPPGSNTAGTPASAAGEAPPAAAPTSGPAATAPAPPSPVATAPVARAAAAAEAPAATAPAPAPATPAPATPAGPTPAAAAAGRAAAPATPSAPAQTAGAPSGAATGAGEAAGQRVSVYHGSINDATAIARPGGGLDPGRTPTWVSRDIRAAQDAISPRRVDPMRDPGIIESRIPRGEFDKVLAPSERPYTGFEGRLGPTSEIVLRTQEQIELFNKYIVGLIRGGGGQ